MPLEESVTEWFLRLQAGDGQAAQRLWERYFERMVLLARERLRPLPRRGADEEDVALCAFDSFCRDARRGRFPDITDRHDLWKLLIAITAQKGIDLARRERTAKRGGTANQVDEAALHEIIGREPTPDFAAQVAEAYERLLERLGDDTLRSVAVWKMEGYSTEEIAGRLGCVVRSVERRLRIIRELWSEEVAP